jgi:hypothetical protein
MTLIYASNFSICFIQDIQIFWLMGLIIWVVQEFLALPRADAIHLLVQYNGNAEMVIQQIFA